MPEYLRVSQSEIHLGKPLPYSVYDKGGNLLLKAGFVINLERHLSRLLAEELYMKEKDSAARRNERNSLAPLPPVRSDSQNTFEALDLVKRRLQRLFEHYKLNKARDEFVQRIEDMSLTVQEACTHDTDAALANLHLDYHTPYTVVHHLQAALLCELIGKKLGIKDDARLVLVNAALTHDLGLLDIQDSLDRQSAPLMPEQQARIASHPTDSARRLERLGVTDPVWLGAVRHHHERLDGSGYPEQLIGDAIKVPTRILAVADIYSAMVRDRPYRKAMVSKEAMRSLLMEQGDKTDRRLIEMMIKEIGVFPPGAIVKLINGEIGVVKQRQLNSTSPIVYSFMNSIGMPMLTPVRRETVNGEHNIHGIVPFSNYRGCIALICGLWINE